MKLGILSVVPSPYQRDLFAAIAKRPEIDRLQIDYLEAAAPDSPWPQKPLAEYESILPGSVIGKGRVRCHSNSNLPDPSKFDAYIVNTTLTSSTSHRMFRRLRDHPNWFFWGEILRKNSGLKSLIQNKLASPLKNARAIVAIGSKARQDYKRRFPNTRVKQVHYYCEIADFDQPRKKHDPPIFLFCGQMIERKGVDLLIAAFAQLHAEGVTAKLLLAGRETELTRNLDLDNIEVAGFTSPDELPQLFTRANVFVLPSRHDGWGVVINQAIGAGLPIISSSAVGAAIDLVEEGKNGTMVEPGNLDSLTNAIRDIALNEKRRDSMAAASKQRAAALDPAIGAARWLEILSCESS